MIDTAYILAGGNGTRMIKGGFEKKYLPMVNANLTNETVPQIPLIFRQIIQLRRAGITRIATQYSEQLVAMLGDGCSLGLTMVHLRQGNPFGSGGDVLRHLETIKRNHFIFVSGDIFFDLKIGTLIRIYNGKTLLVIKRTKHGRYLIADGNPNAIHTLRSPTKSSADFVRCCFSGLGIINSTALGNKKIDKNIDFHEIIDQLIKQNAVFGVELNSLCINMNTFNDFITAVETKKERNRYLKVASCLKNGCLLFDLDFTLIDPSNVVFMSVNAGCKAVGIGPFSYKNIKKRTRFSLPKEKLYDLATTLCGDKKEEFVAAYYDQAMRETPLLFKTVKKALYCLKTCGFKLGIVTSKSKILCEKCLRDLEINGMFDVIITGDCVDQKKPSPEGILKACSQFKVSPTSCIYIGDDLIDGFAARAAGVVFLGVLTGVSTRDEFSERGFNLLFNTFDDLFENIRRISLFGIYISKYPNGNSVLKTEAINDDTKDLSFIAKHDTAKAIKLLLQVEIKAISKLTKYIEKIEQLRDQVCKTLKAGNKVIFIGCGSSGRLLVLAEHLVNCAGVGNSNLKFLCSGGDSVIPRSIPDFEDSKSFANRQFMELNFKKNDMIVAVSASGTAEFLFEMLKESSKKGCDKLAMILCNPVHEILERCTKSLSELSTKVNWISIDVGSMAITGSTRLQATTALLITVALSAGFPCKLNDIVSELISGYSSIKIPELISLIKFETSCQANRKKTVYKVTKDIALGALMDITERTATFNLIPLKNNNNPEEKSSQCFLNVIGCKSAKEAIHAIFGRDPKVLNWDNYSETTLDYLYGFNFGEDGHNDYREAIEIKRNDCLIQFRFSNTKFEITVPKISSLSFQVIFKTIMNINSNISMCLQGYITRNVMTFVTPCNLKLINRICYFSEHFFNKWIDNHSENIERSRLHGVIANELFNFTEETSILENSLLSLKLLTISCKSNFANNVSAKFKAFYWLTKKYNFNLTQAIPSGAGKREYFRINTSKPLVVCLFKDNDESERFVKIYDKLKHNIKVPNIIYFDLSKKFYILDDLGHNRLLETILAANDASVIVSMLNIVVDSLIKLQMTNTLDLEEYNEKLMLSELKDFNNYFMRFLLKRNDEKELMIVTEFCGKLVKEIKSIPKCFCHKDLNSTNVFVSGASCYFIDFQSALKGPFLYDIVCLLTDSYVVFSRNIIDEVTAYFMHRNSFGISKKELKRFFDILVMFRQTKTMGTFAKLFAHGKQMYLRYISNSQDILLDTLKNWPEFKSMYKLVQSFKKTCFDYQYIGILNLLNSDLKDERLIYITGTTTVGKTTIGYRLEKENFGQEFEVLDFDKLKIFCLIEQAKEFDNALSMLESCLGNDFYYFIKHFNNNDDFIKELLHKLKQKIDADPLDKLLESVSKFVMNLNDSTTEKRVTFLLKEKIDEALKSSKRLIVSIPYLPSSWPKIFPGPVVLIYRYFFDLINAIRLRNKIALERCTPNEYRDVSVAVNKTLSFFKFDGTHPLEILSTFAFNHIKNEVHVLEPIKNTQEFQNFSSVSLTCPKFVRYII